MTKHQGPIDLRTFEQVFRGKHFAIGLRASTPDSDPDRKLVRFALLYQDDDAWFLADNHYVVSDRGAPSVALDDLAAVSAEALAWCKTNCDPHMVPLLRGGSVTVGWEFRRS